MRRRSVSAARAAGSGAGAATAASAPSPDAVAEPSPERPPETNGAGRPGSGMRINRTMYARMPRPAVTSVPTTKTTRTNVASTARYSAMPPHTPAMTLFVVLRSSRAGGIGKLPSLPVLVGGGEPQRRDRGDRDARLLRHAEDAVHRDPNPRRRRQQRGQGFGRDCRGERAHRERAQAHKARARDARDDCGRCRRERGHARRAAGARDHERQVEPRWKLPGLEAQRPAQTGLVEELVAGRRSAHADASSARRRSARPRSSWTPTVEGGRPTTWAISST